MTSKLYSGRPLILNRFREFEKHLSSDDARLSAISDSPINNQRKYSVYLNTVCPLAPPPPQSNLVDAAIAAPAAVVAAIAVEPASSAATTSASGARLESNIAAVVGTCPIDAFHAQVMELYNECDSKKWCVAAPDASIDTLTAAVLANVRYCLSALSVKLHGCIRIPFLNMVVID